MKVLSEHRAVNVDIKSLLKTGRVIDFDVQKIETEVSLFYGVSVYDLNSYRDSEAKLMTCFLCHHLLDMSIGKLAHRYNIYKGFLRTNILKYYEKCLTDKQFMGKVETLQSIIQKESCKAVSLA